jgi:hypothetical protein
MARIGRVGHAWAKAAPGSDALASAAALSRTNWRRVVIGISPERVCFGCGSFRLIRCGDQSF